MGTCIKVYPARLTQSDCNTPMNPPLNGFMFRVGDNLIFRCAGWDDAIMTGNQVRTASYPRQVLADLDDNQADRDVFQAICNRDDS